MVVAVAVGGSIFVEGRKTRGFPRWPREAVPEGYEDPPFEEDYIPLLNKKHVSYDFTYSVRDDDTGAAYSHEEERHGDTTKGEYRVSLPDGRLQIVSYIADENGYRAKVSYEPIKPPPEYQPIKYAPQPRPAPGYGRRRRPRPYGGRLKVLRFPKEPRHHHPATPQRVYHPESTKAPVSIPHPPPDKKAEYSVPVYVTPQHPPTPSSPLPYVSKPPPTPYHSTPIPSSPSYSTLSVPSIPKSLPPPHLSSHLPPSTSLSPVYYSTPIIYPPKPTNPPVPKKPSTIPSYATTVRPKGEPVVFPKSLLPSISPSPPPPPPLPFPSSPPPAVTSTPKITSSTKKPETLASVKPLDVTSNTLKAKALVTTANPKVADHKPSLKFPEGPLTPTPLPSSPIPFPFSPTPLPFSPTPPPFSATPLPVSPAPLSLAPTPSPPPPFTPTPPPYPIRTPLPYPGVSPPPYGGPSPVPFNLYRLPYFGPQYGPQFPGPSYPPRIPGFPPFQDSGPLPPRTFFLSTVRPVVS
ncbi:hypothetical protein SK128_014664 [Halocaridina rubra]|uniref:Uncharacterized protein n=1 Tax=Halocaridina rubra TaxID=373956 RepID=A0AAN8XUI9_HALRR